VQTPEKAILGTPVIRRILDVAPDAMVGVDADGRIVFANAAAALLFGFSREELTGMPVETLVPNTQRAAHATHRARYVADPSIRSMGMGLEVTAARKDGTSFPVEIRLSHVELDHAPVAVASIRDVTERKRHDEALRRSEVRLGTLAAMTFAVMRSTDARGEPVGDNMSWHAFTGQTDARAREGGWLEAVHPDDRQRVAAEASRARGEERAYRSEHRLRRIDGEWRDMVVRSAPVRDADGVIREWISAAVDVTERKGMEEALRASEARLRETQAVAGLGSWELDIVANRLTWSDEVYRLLEIDPADFRATYGAFLDAIHPDDRAMVDRAYRASVRDKTPYSIVHRLLMADGRVKFIHERCETHYDRQGTAVRSVGTVLDVSDTRGAEAALEANAQRLRVALGSMDVAVFQQDLALRYTWMGQPQRGYTPEAVLGHTDGELLPQDAARRITEIKRRVLATGQRARETVRVTEEGATSVYDLTVEPLRDGRGAVIGLTGASLDITDRVQAQAKLEESQRDLRALAMHADAVREEERAALARNVHDDFGQVLTALKMDVRDLRRRAKRGEPVVPERFDAIDELVDNLIRTARQVASDLRPPILENLGLRESVEIQAAEFFQRTGIRCDVQCAPIEFPVSDHTELLLYRVVQESLTNVMRHAAATAVVITLRVAGDQLVLTVEDNGRGMAAERPAGKRFGIIGMRERTLALGGQFTIRAGGHGGTVVEVVVPLHHQGQAEEGA